MKNTEWLNEKEKLGKEITLELFDKGIIKTWKTAENNGWTLVSGLWSPFYINLRPLPEYPLLMRKIGSALSNLIENECFHVNKLCGIAYAGIPIACCISLMSSYLPMCYTRKEEPEKYGQHSFIEGVVESGDRIALIDDLVTRLDTKLKVKNKIDKLHIENITINDIVVLFDRGQNADIQAKENNMNLFSLIKFQTALEWLKYKISSDEYIIIKKYLKNPIKFQNEVYRKELLHLY